MNQTAAAGFENLIGYYDPPVQVRSSLSLSLSLSLILPFSDLLLPINFLFSWFWCLFSNFCVVSTNVIAEVFSSSVIAFDSIQF